MKDNLQDMYIIIVYNTYALDNKPIIVLLIFD